MKLFPSSLENSGCIDVLTVLQINGTWETEALLCRVKDELYELVKPPFYARQLAVGDLIKAQFSEEEGIYYADHKVKSVGNSTIQVQCNKLKSIGQVKEKLAQLGCVSETNYTRNRLAIHVPKIANYSNVQLYLIAGQNNLLWNIEESCIGHILNSSAPPTQAVDIEAKVDVWLQRFGWNLRQIRTGRFASWEQVSIATEIPISVLKAVENGRAADFGISQFLRLATYCGIEPKKAFQ